MVELEYRVASENARAFHNVMQNVQRYGQRNGAYGWSIGRDIADPSCGPSAITARHGSIIAPTQPLDALGARIRCKATAFHVGPEPVRLRRMLERPFGSVRRKDDVPDRAPSEL